MILLLNSREIRCKIGAKFDLQIYVQNGYFDKNKQRNYLEKFVGILTVFWGENWCKFGANFGIFFGRFLAKF